MLSFDGLGSGFAKDGHHVEKVFKGAIAVLARAEDLANPVSEWIDAQLRILEDFRHWQLGVAIVANFFRRQGFELFMSAIK